MLNNVIKTINIITWLHNSNCPTIQVLRVFHLKLWYPVTPTKVTSSLLTPGSPTIQNPLPVYRICLQHRCTPLSTPLATPLLTQPYTSDNTGLPRTPPRDTITTTTATTWSTTPTATL